MKINLDYINKPNPNKILIWAYLLGTIVFLTMAKILAGSSQLLIIAVGMAFFSIYAGVFGAYYYKFKYIWKKLNCAKNPIVLVLFLGEIAMLIATFLIAAFDPRNTIVALISISILNVCKAIVLSKELIKIEELHGEKSASKWNTFLVFMNPISGIWVVFSRLKEVEIANSKA